MVKSNLVRVMDIKFRIWYQECRNLRVTYGSRDFGL